MRKIALILLVFIAASCSPYVERPVDYALIAEWEKKNSEGKAASAADFAADAARRNLSSTVVRPVVTDLPVSALEFKSTIDISIQSYRTLTKEESDLLYFQINDAIRLFEKFSHINCTKQRLSLNLIELKDMKSIFPPWYPPAVAGLTNGKIYVTDRVLNYHTDLYHEVAHFFNDIRNEMQSQADDEKTAQSFERWLINERLLDSRMPWKI